VTTPRFFGAYFGEPWPSGVCEDGGAQVETPRGELCELCKTPIFEHDQGNFIGRLDGGLGPVHRECSLRSVLGGYGHHIDHDYWCTEQHDPDGDLTYRESALAVWGLLHR
jgi:hypothetical protein